MPDVFHTAYRELSDAEKELMKKLKHQASELLRQFDNVLAIRNPGAKPGVPLEGGREIALARTALEESVMWAVKGLTK